MPVLPILGTGLLPLLQWLVIPSLILWQLGKQCDPQKREAAV